MGVTDQPTAYFFDRAIYIFGTTLEAQLEEAGKSKGKRPKSESQVALARGNIMAKWLRLQRFAEPAKRG